MGTVVDAMVLQYVNWNYTYRCNYNCSHCYTRAEVYPKDLPDEAYVNFATQIIEAGVFAVGFGGGEPLIRRDFESIITLLAACDVETHLTTNGSFLSAAKAECLARAGLNLMTVSIDSPNAQEHDLFRRKPGSFAAACRAIEASVNAGIKTHLTAVLNATNVHHVAELHELARMLGVDGLAFKWFRPVGNGFDNRDDYELSSQAAESAAATVVELQASSPLEIAFFQDREQGCSCGLIQLTIRPNGDVALCPYGSGAVGNMQKTTLEEIWRHVAQGAMEDTGAHACCATEGTPSLISATAGATT